MIRIGVAVARLLKLDGPDIVVFMLSSLIGFLVKFYLPHGPWTAYIATIVSYHLFLAWLLISGDRKGKFSVPIIPSILTHIACLSVVCALGMLRHSIPFFWAIRYLPGASLLRYGVPAFAVFERSWLYGFCEVEKPEDEAQHASPLLAQATTTDYDAWLHYLGQADRTFRKPGVTVKTEYELWMLERLKDRPVASSPAEAMGGD
jgi:hypothetical protein